MFQLRKLHGPFTALVAATFLVSAAAPVAGSPAKTPAADLQNYLAEEARAGRFSGAVGVATSSGTLISQGYGLANIDSSERNSVETKFNLASLGKLFTRIAVLQLVQAGKIRMDEKVGAYLPNYPNADVRGKVTIRHLYDMQSGIGSYWNATFAQRRTQLRTTDDYLALFATDPLQFEPGTQTQYSNGGYILLGKIIEQASGLSYDDYVRRNIIGPAQLTDTGHFALDETVPRMAVGYTASPAGGHAAALRTAAGPAAGPSAIVMMHGSAASAATLRPNTDELPGRGLSAGGGYSSVRDLLKLSTALRQGKLLDEERSKQLFGKGYETGGYMTVAGGFPGASTQFSMFADGTTIVVLSNRDMPIASVLSERIAASLGKELKRIAPTIIRRQQAH